MSLVALAREQLPESVLFIATNGDALSLTRAIELFEAGLDRITINCYDDVGGRVARMRALAQALCRKLPDTRYCESATFAEMVGPRVGSAGQHCVCLRDCTALRIEDLDYFAGNVPGAPIPAAPLALACYRPFEQLHVRYNGDVVLCHCD